MSEIYSNCSLIQSINFDISTSVMKHPNKWEIFHITRFAIGHRI